MMPSASLSVLLDCPAPAHTPSVSLPRRMKSFSSTSSAMATRSYTCEMILRSCCVVRLVLGVSPSSPAFGLCVPPRAARPTHAYACFTPSADNRSVEGCPVLATAVHAVDGIVSHGTVTVALTNLGLSLTQSSALAAVSTDF